MKNMQEKRKVKVTEKKHRWDNDLYQAENYMEQKNVRSIAKKSTIQKNTLVKG